MLYTSDNAKAALEGAYDWETQLEREVDNYLRNPVPTTALEVRVTPNRRYARKRKAIAAALAIGFVLFLAMPYQLGQFIGVLISLVLSTVVVVAMIAAPIYLIIKIARRERR